MIMHHVCRKGTTAISYTVGSKEEADERIKDLRESRGEEYVYRTYRVWHWRDVRAGRDYAIHGPLEMEFISSVEEEMDYFIDALGLANASGCIFKSVRIRRLNENEVELIIQAYPFSRSWLKYKPEMENDTNLKTGSITIENVKYEEFPHEEYEFEIIRSED